MCYREPLVEVRDNGRRIIYGQVTPELAEEIFHRHIQGREILEEHVALDIAPDGTKRGSEADFHNFQTRIVLRNCGTIDPESIEEYEAVGGYQGIRKALRELTAEQIIQEVKDSGLRGRG
ncbi:MAG: hypothetical protein AMJ79_10205, partial [Phycisphaerae bacterium SM23_30]